MRHWTDTNNQKYTAKNSFEWWLFNSLGGAVPGIKHISSRPGTIITNMDRAADNGPVEFVIGLSDRYARWSGRIPRATGTSQSLHQIPMGDTAQPRPDLTHAQEALGLVGVRPTFWKSKTALRLEAEKDALKKIEERTKEVERPPATGPSMIPDPDYNP